MIRKIRESDKAEYIKMAKDFYNSDAVLSPIPISNFELTFNELMQSDRYAEAYIFESDKTVAGFGLIAKTFSQEAGGMVVWIEEIYVKKDFRGKGLGSEFINFIKANVPAKRYRLETEPENLAAQRLYLRHSFNPLEYINFYLES